MTIASPPTREEFWTRYADHLRTLPHTCTDVIERVEFLLLAQEQDARDTARHFTEPERLAEIHWRLRYHFLLPDSPPN